MKKLQIISIGIALLGILSLKANNISSNHSYYEEQSFFFTIDAVEFAIFPDGSFDFAFLKPRHHGNFAIDVYNSQLNISYNSGYNYDFYVQYDQYGAVIQIEHIPIFYDAYGRVTQIGDIYLNYRRNRLIRIGGLSIFYNRRGLFTHSLGFVNAFNRRYRPRPWHWFYRRPFRRNCIVYNFPYRNDYRPIRYTYKNHRRLYKNRGRVAYQNGRRDFTRPIARTNTRTTATNRRVNRSTSISSRTVSPKKSTRSVNRTVANTRKRTSKVASNRKPIEKKRNVNVRRPAERKNITQKRNGSSSRKRATQSRRTQSKRT